MDQWGRMAEGTLGWSKKRKSMDRGDGKFPNKKFQSPLIITAPSGKTATKTKSRLPLCDGNGSLDEDQIKHQFLARISEAEALLKQKRNTSQESILASLSKSGMATPRKMNPGTTTPNPFSFMTPGRRQEESGRRDSLVGRRLSVAGRRDSVCGPRVSISGRRENPSVRTPCTQRVSMMSARKMRLRASMQLKMLESQEQQASRAAQVKWEVWMDKQERAYAGLLNEILKQPMDPNVKVMEIKHSVASLGRSSGHGAGIGPSLPLDSSRSHLRNSGRDPSDDKNPLPVGQQNRKIVSKARISTSRTSRELKDSTGNDLHASDACLSQICSASDLKRRLVPYLEDNKCDRIISTMTQIAKYIDDGRLRMKPNCILLSDVALRTKAFDVLFSYNPVWLRLGLAIVLGPIASYNKSVSVLDVIELEGETHPQATFLQVLIEEHFFGDSPLAKQFAANKSIDGLYREGYKEALGKIILKRIFLFVLVLDKIKSATALDGQRGIDGLDGGSPILFQPNGCVKSSRQALEDFLSHVMQGEGDLIVHVGKLGYHVSHTQAPLFEYNFEVRNVVEDLQDGIRLCRLAQLMSHNHSILGNIKFPCQAPKKRTHNCELALKSLAQSGVLLEDETGAPITADHISSGQREKTLSLIWNFILHLQVPLLVSHPKLFQELELGGVVANPDAKGHATLDVLLSWVQAVCANVDGLAIQNFSTSFADGQVLCHLISNFLPQCLPRHAIKIPRNTASNVIGEQTNQNGQWELRSALSSDIGVGEDRNAVIHNFQMVENAAKLLGIAPEVLQVSDMVDGDPCTSERNVIIFVAHLCSALLNANPQKFQSSSTVVPTASKEESNFSHEDCSKVPEVHSDGSRSSRQDETLENAATCIQAWYRGRRQRLMFEKIRTKIILLQRFVRAWLVKKRVLKDRTCSRTEEDDDTVVIQVDESEAFQPDDLKHLWNHVILLQSRVRARKLRVAFLAKREGAITIQHYWRRYQFQRIIECRRDAAVIIQATWRRHLVQNLLSKRYSAACAIQKHFRGYVLRVQIQKRETAALIIQKFARGYIQKLLYRSRLVGVKRLQAFFRGAQLRVQAKRDANNATKIQALWRGCSTRRLLNRWRAAASVIQLHFRGYKQRTYYKTLKVYIAEIQAAFRGALLRKRLRLMREAAGQIQSGWRRFKLRRVSEEIHAAATRIQSRYRFTRQRTWYLSYRSRVILLQAMVRGRLAWKRLRDVRVAVITLQSRWRGFLARKTMAVEKLAAMHIQKCFRSYLQFRRKQLQATQHSAAVTIQSFYRGHVQKKLYYRETLAIVRIQRNWRGFVQGRINEIAAKDVVLKQATRSAACVIQASWRGHLVRKKLITHAPEHCVEKFVQGGCASMQQVTSSEEYDLTEHNAAQLVTFWVKAHILRCRFLELRRAAITIQRMFRGHKARQDFHLIIRCICRIQAHWRGHKWRSGQSRMKQHMQELRLRMQSTAAAVDDSQRLGNRLTEALAQLLSQKTVSGILHICATIDMATEHSKHCCERLAEGGAVTKLLMLIQTVNRSPPHQQVLKHALSILANLARFPNLAFLIAGEADSINIIVEQLLILRNKEAVFSKAMKILLHVCRTPGCVDIIQQDLVAIRRLHNVAVLLERRFVVEKRNLEKLAPSTPSPVRKAADHKMRETVQQKQSIMSIMPDLVAKQLNQNPPPAAPCRRKESVLSNDKPLLSTSGEGKTRERVAPVKSSNVATKVNTATKSITSKNECSSQRPAREAALQATRLVPLTADRKHEGAVKFRPNPLTSGRGDSAPNNLGISAKPKISNGLPRAPLTDRSNNATKAVQK